MKHASTLEAIAAVAADLAKVGISKDRKNESQGYRFRGIDDIYGTLSPILAEHQLVILPRVAQRVETVRATKNGGSLYSVAVEVEFHLIGASDAGFTASVWGEAMDSADKATNKAMSAAYKYLALMAFCIPIEGIEDADQTTPEETKPVQKPATKPATTQPAAAKEVLDPYDSVEVAKAHIEQCKTVEQLGRVGMRLKVSTKLTPYDKNELRAAYEAKDQELKK